MTLLFLVVWFITDVSASHSHLQIQHRCRWRNVSQLVNPAALLLEGICTHLHLHSDKKLPLSQNIRLFTSVWNYVNMSFSLSLFFSLYSSNHHFHLKCLFSPPSHLLLHPSLFSYLFLPLSLNPSSLSSPHLSTLSSHIKSLTCSNPFFGCLSSSRSSFPPTRVTNC